MTEKNQPAEWKPAQQRAREALVEALQVTQGVLQEALAERGRIRRALAELTGVTDVVLESGEDEQDPGEDPGEKLDEKIEDGDGEPPIKEKEARKGAARSHAPAAS